MLTHFWQSFEFRRYGAAAELEKNNNVTSFPALPNYTILFIYLSYGKLYHKVIQFQ